MIQVRRLWESRTTLTRFLQRATTWEAIEGVLLFLPAFAIIAWFILRPMGENMYRSLFKVALQVSKYPQFVGLQNYWDLLTGRYFWNSIRNTLLFTLVPMVVQVLISFGLGLLLQRHFRGRGFLQALLLLPWAVPTLVSAFAWYFLVNPEVGLANRALLDLGLIDRPRVFLDERLAASVILLLALSWRGLPFMLSITIAGLRQIPLELYEAAEVDGASWLQSHWYITIPSMKRVLAIAIVLRIMWYFSLFDFIWLLTRGGPMHSTQTTALEIWIQTFGLLRWGRASAVSVLMLAVLTGFVLIFFRITREEG